MCGLERWRNVVGYEGLYQVSDLGRVRSIERVVPHKRYGTMKQKGRILRPVKRGRGGRLRVTLYDRGVQRDMYVRRLVANAWAGS